jgi:hypothetical protein
MPVALLFLLMAQEPIAQDAIAQNNVLRSGCSTDDQQVARLKPDDPLKVMGALAGGDQTCYKVRVSRDGETITGYLLGETNPAIAEFVREREHARKESFAAAQKADAAAPSASAAPLPPGMPPSFEDFSARDVNGRAVSLAGMGGRVILVSFWSPQYRSSANELVAVQSLYSQFKGQDLKAVAISSLPNPGAILAALDDITLSFPQVPDRYGLTARYASSAKGPITLVLDSSHRIVAAGPMGPALQKKVMELLAQK